MNKRIFAVTAAATVVFGSLTAISLTTHPVTQVEIGRPVVSYDVHEATTPPRPLCRPFDLSKLTAAGAADS